MQVLPFSKAAQNNSQPILAELTRLLAAATSVLEVGAGTGQHAEAFAQALPHLSWQPTEHPEALATLQPRCERAVVNNLQAPRVLDIGVRPWMEEACDAIYTANTLHIVSMALVEEFFAGAGELQALGGMLIVYGPFNYGGRFTSPSNETFDAWLRDRDPQSGIRDFEWVNEQAGAAGYRLAEDIAMPANNRLLCWQQN